MAVKCEDAIVFLPCFCGLDLILVVTVLFLTKSHLLGSTKRKSIILYRSQGEIRKKFITALISVTVFCYRTVEGIHIFFSWSLGRCNQRTTSGKCCVLPFKYRGRRYNRCAKTRRGRPWCPTGSGVYIRNQPWGYCRGGKRKDQPFLNSVSHTLNFIAISKLIQISLR